MTGIATASPCMSCPAVVETSPVPMVIIGPLTPPNPNPCIVAGEPWVWGDVRNNGKRSRLNVAKFLG